MACVKISNFCPKPYIFTARVMAPERKRCRILFLYKGKNIVKIKKFFISLFFVFDYILVQKMIAFFFVKNIFVTVNILFIPNLTGFYVYNRNVNYTRIYYLFFGNPVLDFSVRINGIHVGKDVACFCIF